MGYDDFGDSTPRGANWIVESETARPFVAVYSVGTGIDSGSVGFGPRDLGPEGTQSVETGCRDIRSLRRFVTARGVAIVVSELKWVWLPAGKDLTVSGALPGPKPPRSKPLDTLEGRLVRH